MRKVIFDTDPGVDDAMALAFLCRRPELELIGVTTVHGNGPIDVVTRNALHLKDRFGFAAPVAQGSGVTMLNREGSPALHVHGDKAHPGARDRVVVLVFGTVNTGKVADRVGHGLGRVVDQVHP